MNLQRRHLIAAGMASTLMPWQAWSQAIEKPKVTIAVGGKNLFYYLPLTIAEQLGYISTEILNDFRIDIENISRQLNALKSSQAKRQKYQLPTHKLIDS